MKLAKIEVLIDKYYKGETSLSEEKTLREFFLNEEIPKNLLPAKKQFQYLSFGEDIPFQSSDFKDELINSITSNKKNPIIANRTIRLAVLGIVAGIALVFTIDYFSKNTNNSTITNGINTSIHNNSNKIIEKDTIKINSQKE